MKGLLILLRNIIFTGVIGGTSLIIILIFLGYQDPVMREGRSYYYKATSVKNSLVMGITECMVREAENQTTKFSDATSFLQYDENWEIKPTNKNTCFEAIAFPKTEEFTWYKIVFDQETGRTIKTCGYSSGSRNVKSCGKDNTWL